MECPNTFHQKLDKEGEFWKEVQATGLQTFARVRWSPSESHWSFQNCKFHTFQAVFRRALSELKGESESLEKMKRGPEGERPELYVFNVDSAITYQLTPGEKEFLRKIHLEDFVASVSWGVLHSKLVTEAIASLDPKTWVTKVKDISVSLIAEDWREQFQQLFHLTIKEASPVTKTWQLADLFPAYKGGSTETVRIAECQHPGARRPLRILSSFFCLNPTQRNNITVAFLDYVIAALNGQKVDWPQEFYHELASEILALHKKHSAPKVKVEKTSVGPHVTLILRAGGVLDVREELEAGYRTQRSLTIEEQVPHPKTKKVKGAEESLDSQLEAAATSQIPVTQVYSATPQQLPTKPGALEAPGIGVVLETQETWQPPNPLPTMVDQICQVHRRLENLLTSFTTKAPQKLVNRMNEEFFKIQRTTILQQDISLPNDDTAGVLLKHQGLQLEQMARQLANSDGLLDINIEALFLLEEEVATLQDKLEQLQNQVYSLQGQKGEAIHKLEQLQHKFEAQTHLLETKKQEIDHLDIQVTDMQKIAWRQEECFSRQKEEKLQLESQLAYTQQEIERLSGENNDLKADLEAKVKNAEAPAADWDPTHPIASKEKHTLAVGVSSKLLNELRRDLSMAQHMNRQLKRQLDKQDTVAEEGMISPFDLHPRAEIYHQIINHTSPPQSVMQCHRAYGGLNLLLGGVPFLQAGCRLDLAQAKQIWDKADAAAKDTITFMWCFEEIKLPLGAMEALSGCPPFYIKRYVLRCIKLLAQHLREPEILKEPLPTLRSYSHGQYHLIKNFQKSKPDWFQHALKTLATEDVTVCYEAIKFYQDMANRHEHLTLSPTVHQLKHFVTSIFEEQQNTLSKKRFGTINSGTLLIPPREYNQPQANEHESMGTCFL